MPNREAIPSPNEPSGDPELVATDKETGEVRPARVDLDAVLGSLNALPHESTDLDVEIDAAHEAAASRRMRRLDQRP